MCNFTPPISGKFIAFGLALLSGTASFAAEAEVKFNAAVSYPPQAAGMYQFTTSSYNPVQLARNVYASGGGMAYDGYYYGIRFEVISGIPGIAQQSFDLKTWEIEDNYSGTMEDVATALAYNEDRDETFGCYYNSDGDSFRFCSVNVPYWGKTKIADLPKGWGACSFDAAGTLWAIDEDGALFTVDTRTGALTPKGDTGLATEWITGGFIDNESGKFIYSVKTSSEAALYSVDLATASATKLYDFENEEQVGGFYLPVAEPAAGVPAAVSSVNLSFSGTSLTGKVQFQMPRYKYDGSAGEGPLTWHVYANGREVATGESTFGASGYQAADVTLDKSDTYSFAVTTSNAAGESPKKRASKKFVGVDTPKAPSSVTVQSYADGNVTLRWGSVSSGVNNGTIDRSNLVYRVTRYPGAVVVSAADLKTTTLVDPLPLPDTRTEYYYTVEAVTGDLVSAPAKSATFQLGAIEPPFAATFPNSSALFGWSQINNNSKTWSVSSNAVYVSTNSKPADNWIILPPLKVKEGCSYEVSVSLKGYSASYTETFEVMAGSEATAEAMTNTVIPSTEVKTGSYTAFNGSLLAPADGMCYMGIHATSAAGGYLYVESITIREGVSTLAPGAVTELAVVADPTGAHSATVSFTLPAVNLVGDALDAVTSVELLRDGEVVKTATEGFAVGQPFSMVDDTNPACGNHTYTVVCYNRHGAGATASADAYVGFSAPVQPEAVNMTETEPGHVVATWTAVTRDVDGRTLGADDVVYRISKYVSGEQILVAENVKGTTYQYDALDAADGQKFVQTLVEAVTEGGTAKPKPSSMTAVGKAYEVPWSESFGNGVVKSLIGYEVMQGTDRWTIIDKDDAYGIYPYDEDGGMMFYEGYLPAKCALLTGKIDLADLPVPAFIFYVYNFKTTSENTNLVEVEVNGGAGYQKLYSSTVGQTGPENQWNKVVVPLDDFAGQSIQIRVASTSVQYAFHYVDAFQVTSYAEHNLSLRSIEAPASVERNTLFDIKVNIANMGLNRALGYKVNLYRDDELVESRSGDALEPDAATAVTFNHGFDIYAPESVTFKAEVEYGPDLVPADNSREVVVEARNNSLPTVSDLAASPADGKVALQWSEPAGLSSQVAAETHNFDDPALSWNTSLPGWTFYDGDKATIGGIGSKKLPVSGRQSFFVMDNTYEVLNSSQFAAHSGNQFLCSMYVMQGQTMIKSDDWAISPELTGQPQVISLWASSFKSDADQTQYLETFEILYSTTGTDVEDFTLVEEFKAIPPMWTQYTAYLPEGAKYFAIRCTSYNQYMLFVDDVTFRAKNGPAETVAVNGYNVYRDKVRLNAEPVTVPTYTDEAVDNSSTYTYAVTTLYAAGESHISNEVVVDMAQSGIGQVGAHDVTISAVDGAIVVTGAAGKVVTVAAVDGTTVYSAKAASRTCVPVAPGLYLVTAGSATAKVLVK